MLFERFIRLANLSASYIEIEIFWPGDTLIKSFVTEEYTAEGRAGTTVTL